MSYFDQALKFVLKWEGFISNDPKDPGGLTIWGISYRSHKEAVLEMEKLINEQKKDEAFAIAKKIYYENYWLKTDCDKLFFPMNIIIFDTAVNMGRKRAFDIFIKSLGWEDYLFRRIELYAGFKQAKLYLRGWVNRVISLYHFVKEEADENA